jgi:hypothetical protein
VGLGARFGCKLKKEPKLRMKITIGEKEAGNYGKQA